MLANLIQPSKASATLYNAFNHPLRQRLLEMVSDEKKCVSYLVDQVGTDQSVISNHLAKLRRAGLVTTEKEGPKVYYKVNTTALRELEKANSLLKKILSDANK